MVTATKTRIDLEAVGSDAELFLADKENKPVPCIGMVGGTKEKPEPIPGLKKGFAMQEDNVMLEFNIPAAKDAHGFVYNLMRVREALEEQVAKQGLHTVVKPIETFSAIALTHPQAQKVGCEPDANAWERKVNPRPQIANTTSRCAGAHVHISYKINGKVPTYPECMGEAEGLVMLLDVYLGVASLYFDRDVSRRQWYGRAGAFRPKEYGPKAAGLEYRVLNPSWVSEPRYAAWVFQQVQTAVTQANAYGSRVREHLAPYKDMVYAAINEGNTTAFHRIVNAFGILGPR